MVVIKRNPEKNTNLAWRSECGKFILCKTGPAPGSSINKYFLANYSTKYNGVNKLLYGLDTIMALKDLGFRLRKDLQQELDILEEPLPKLKPIKVEGMKLYPFQEEGVSLLEYFNGNALLADEMGLGKTIQAIAYLKRNPKIRPALIVCPSCVKDKWKEEIEKYEEDAVVELINGQKASNLPNADYYIINYDIVSYWKVKIRNRKPKAIVIDECHMIKNSGAGKNRVARTSAVLSIAKKCDHVIALSGTPILSRPLEIYNAVNLINKNLFAGKQSFGMRYCDGKRAYRAGWDFNGSSNEKELHSILKNTCLIRRLKKDVLNDLPAEPLPNIIKLRLTNQSEYNRAHTDIISYLKNISKDKAQKAEKAKHLVRLEHLKQLACKGKMKEVGDWIENTLEQVNKLVVFAWHQSVTEMLYERFKKIAIVPRKHGTSHECATKFNNDKKIKLFIGNIKADGAGIDLVSAADLAFIEYAWTPGDMDQARDRIYRIGQKNKRLNLTYLAAKGTVDEDIIELLDNKRKTVSSIIDGKSGKGQADIFGDLIRRMAKQG